MNEGTAQCGCKWDGNHCPHCGHPAGGINSARCHQHDLDTAMVKRVRDCAPLFGAQMRPFIEAFVARYEAALRPFNEGSASRELLRALARDLMAATP